MLGIPFHSTRGLLANQQPPFWVAISALFRDFNHLKALGVLLPVCPEGGGFQRWVKITAGVEG